MENSGGGVMTIEFLSKMRSLQNEDRLEQSENEMQGDK